MMPLSQDDAHQEDDDPFSCFGSDDDSCSENDEQQAAGDRLVREVNNKLAVGTCTALVELLPLNNPGFEVFDAVPPAGKGLRALKAYSYGDEILRETAAMRVPNHHAATSFEDAQRLHARAVQKSFDGLHPMTQGAVMELFGVGDDESGDGLSDNCSKSSTTGTPGVRRDVVDIYQSNSFQLQNETNGGLFLTIARMNHSCRPNCNHIWRPDLQQTLVFATKDIAVGDEICTTYGPSECLDTAGRRSYLKSRFFFDCRCTMCQEGNREGGDARMVELNDLQEDISLLAQSGQPETALQAVERCRNILNEQGNGSGVFVKALLHLGYQVSLVGLQDKIMARSYLSQELVAINMCEGVGSPNAIKIQQLLDDMVSS
jgi:hypothetical protein